MTPNTYGLIKAATNVISGISMITLIVLGVAYLSFKNAFVFQDIKIEITNNPITQDLEKAIVHLQRELEHQKMTTINLLHFYSLIFLL